MSFQGPYREVKHEIESESEEESNQVPQGFQPPQVQEEDIDIMICIRPHWLNRNKGLEPSLKIKLVQLTNSYRVCA